MHHRQLRPVVTVISVLCCAPISSLAQDQDGLVTQVRTLFRSGFQTAPEPLESLAFLPTPIQIPSDEQLARKAVEGFANIPTLRDDFLVGFGKTPVRQLLRGVSSQILVGQRVLSARDKDELAAARKILFEIPDDPDSGPSPLYKRYQGYSKDYADLLEKIKAATMESERTDLRLKLQRLERDWQLMGGRARIDQALNVVDSLGGGARETRDLQADWVKMLEGDPQDILNPIWMSFDSSSGWTAVSTSEKPQVLAVRASTGAARAEINLNIESISLRYKLVNVADRSLLHPFLRRNNWKFKDNSVLSDGAATAAQNEILPTYCGALVVAHMLEIRFADDRATKQLRDLLQRSENVSIGGMPIKQQGNNAFFLASRYLCVTDPYIIAAVVGRLPKTPNPAPSVGW